MHVIHDEKRITASPVPEAGFSRITPRENKEKRHPDHQRAADHGRHHHRAAEVPVLFIAEAPDETAGAPTVQKPTRSQEEKRSDHGSEPPPASGEQMTADAICG